MRALFLAVAIALIAVSPARAEPGDYSELQTIWNILFPPGADNEVTEDQTIGDFPLLANPEGFDDEFDPGAYFQWQVVQMAASTGAVCGNGTPYKFFVNRAPNTSNMLVFMEPGGACWDYESCTGEADLGARNPDGIPDDYLDVESFVSGLTTPFIFRLHPWSRVKTQRWTLVYVPYCTGDTFVGDSIRKYEKADGSGEYVMWHHNGLRNVRAVIAWLKNNLQRPVQMLSTGCSAGGVGSVANYAHLRRDMEPDFGFLINDSGPIFSVAAGEDAPSYGLQEQMRELWRLDRLTPEDDVSPLEYLAQELPALDLSDMGSVYPALSERFAQDRLGHTHFMQDYNFSRYSYEEFYPFVKDAPDDLTRRINTHLAWYVDTLALRNELETLPNFGGYFPNLRRLNDSHCTTIVDFVDADIQEAGLEIDDFIDDVLDGDGPVLDALEQDWSLDPAKPLNLFHFLIDRLL